MGTYKDLKRTQIDQLTLFIDRANKLPERACFTFLTSYKSSFTLNWKKGENFKLTNLVKPEVETFRSFLIDFRPFVSVTEPVFVNRILNICINRARHIALREQLINLQLLWNKESKVIGKQTSDILKGSKIIYKEEDAFLKWLNGTVFHLDIEKERISENWGMISETFEVEVARYVGWCSNFILHLSRIIHDGLNNNEFDFTNDFTPHTKPNVRIKIEEPAKKLIFNFWKGSKAITQTLAICGEHDQDPVIVVEGYEDGITDLQDINVEIHACCIAAVDDAVLSIKEHFLWKEYLKNNPIRHSEPIKVLEIEVTDRTDIDCIETALKNYKQKWRKAVGKMRCPIHRFAPGARAFGEDIYCQGGFQKTDSAIYLQGCCEPFINQIMQNLRKWLDEHQ